VYDPAGRISAKQAVHHPYFTEGGRTLNRQNGYHWTSIGGASRFAHAPVCVWSRKRQAWT